MNVPLEDPQVWNLIAPYLDQALDLPPEQVGDWLDALERDQPSIATMLRELLALRDAMNAAGFLAEPLGDGSLALLQIRALLDNDY